MPWDWRQRAMLEFEVLSGGATPEVRRFWYANYVHSLGIDSPHADHGAGELHDPLAELGELFLARDFGGRLLGTALCVRADAGDLGYYETYFGIRGRRREVTFTSKLVVDPTLAESRLALQLAKQVYAYRFRQGIRIDFADCQERNVRLFQRLGYRRLRGDGNHPIYGRSARLFLAVQDHRHLDRCGSPLVRAWRRTARPPRGTPEPEPDGRVLSCAGLGPSAPAL